jgi:hypothetical protein
MARADFNYRAGFSELANQKKHPFGYRGQPPLAETIATKQILSLHRTNALNRQRSGLHAIAAETAAHTRRKNSARDEGAA